MSSIEDRLRAFFAERLVPAAERARARGVSYFPPGPDDEESWYESPPETPAIMEIDDGQFGAKLKQMWQDQGHPELADLAEAFEELARELELKDDQTEDVSPFMYVMF